MNYKEKQSNLQTRYNTFMSETNRLNKQKLSEDIYIWNKNKLNKLNQIGSGFHSEIENTNHFQGY